MNDLVGKFVKTFFDYVNLNTGEQLENFSASFWLQFSNARHHTRLSVAATTEHTAHRTGEHQLVVCSRAYNYGVKNKLYLPTNKLINKQMNQ